MRSPARFFGNVLMVAVSVILGLLVCYYIYQKWLRSDQHMIVAQGNDNEYALALYSQQGKPLTEIDGNFKIVTDPFMLYRNYPMQSSKSYSIDFWGFRGGYQETASRKAFVVGGSAAFGQGLSSDEETFAHRLDACMPGYRFINAGVIGILSGQELSYMVHYLDSFTPALYVVFDGWNDIFGPYMYARELPSARVPIGFHFAFFEIERRLDSLLKLQTQKNNDDHSPERIGPLPTGFRIEDEAMLFEEIAETYIANIDKMHAFARARQADFFLVFQPELGNKRNKTETERQILAKWEDAYGYSKRHIPGLYKTLIEKAEAFCRAHKIPFLNINTIPQFADNPDTLFLDVVHPNAWGHDIIADAICTSLKGTPLMTTFGGPSTGIDLNGPPVE